MKQINNKGLTTIEILVTFVITATLIIAMYASIANLKEKQTIATYKESIITYNDLLTKEIQDDLVMKHLISVIPDESNNKVTFFFENGDSKELSIKKSSSEQENGNFTLCKGNSQTQSIKDEIKYGSTTYPLPDLGSDYVDIPGKGCSKVYSLKLKQMHIKTVKDREEDDYVLNIKIELWHPDLGNKYSIDIISPINYK